MKSKVEKEEKIKWQTKFEYTLYNKSSFIIINTFNFPLKAPSKTDCLVKGRL